MAETPNNDIEKRLRDYAQQRRDAAGTPTLHPATRALLQAEVKQRLGSAAAAAKPAQRSGWAIFWPRFAFAFAIVAVVGLVGIFLFPPGNRTKDNFTVAKLGDSESTLFATNSRKETADLFATASEPPIAAPTVAAVASPAPAPAARRMIVADSSVVTGSADVNTLALDKSPRTDHLTPRLESTKALKPGTPPITIKDSPGRYSLADTSSDFDAKRETRTKAFDASGSNLGSASQATANNEASRIRAVGGGSRIQMQNGAPSGYLTSSDISAPVKLDEAQAKKASPSQAQNRALNYSLNNPTQRFYRNVNASEELKKAGKITVLDEFTIEQNGDALTVIDRDGSIYNGFARVAGADRQNINAASGNPIQLVPNSSSGGRAGAMLNQNTLSRDGRNSTPLQLGDSQNAATTPLSPAQNASAMQNYFFRVEGTNRSLNQRVVLTGNLLQNNTGAAQNAGINQTFRNQQNLPTGVQYNFNRQSPAQSNFINGRVQLDNTKPVEFNALSVDP